MALAELRVGGLDRTVWVSLPGLTALPVQHTFKFAIRFPAGFRIESWGEP